MLEDLRGRDAGEALADRLAEPVQQGPAGQLHRDDQPPLVPPRAEGGQQVRVADVLDDLQGAKLDRPDVAGQRDELQGDLEPARAGGLPDLAEAAPAQPLDQGIAGDGLGAGPEFIFHDAPPPRTLGPTLDPGGPL